MLYIQELHNATSTQDQLANVSTTVHYLTIVAENIHRASFIGIP